MCVAGFARDPHPVRFPIRSADPWLIKTLLEGGQATEPELSMLWLARGMPMGPPPMPGKSLVEGGYLVVNPTDNSLWFFPSRK